MTKVMAELEKLLVNDNSSETQTDFGRNSEFLSSKSKFNYLIFWPMRK